MARLKLLGILLPIVFVLPLAFASAPAFAQNCEKNPDHKNCSGSGGGGGKDQTAAGFNDEVPSAGISSDTGDLYVNGEPGVDVKIGGPGRPIRIDLNGDGSQGSRFFIVNANCVAAGTCPNGDSVSGDHPALNTTEYAILDVFHVADMPADGKFYPKNAQFQLAGFASGEVLAFRFREPELFNPGGPCSDQGGSTGAGASVWVARSQDGSIWTVTTETPPPGELGDGLTGDEAGDIACLEVQTGATGLAFGGNYRIPFAVTVGPESFLAP